MVEHILKIREAASDRRDVTVSIEVEKKKPELVALLPLADVVSRYSYVVQE